ncbi:MAG: hypothetical protein J6K95_05990 [Rikenellaceae bacterium]|nr:hypothetical protein [Rikenellaceae bacterium]
MKKFISIVAILCLFGGAAAAQQPVKKKVAVYITGDVESGYKKVIGSKMVSGITRSNGYAAVERTGDFLAELMKEQDYQMSGAVSDNQIARLGQQFGVRYVLVADVSEVFESMFVSARMIDVQTAQIINSTEASQVVTNMESLTKIAEDVVLEIIGIPTFEEESVKLLGVYSTAKDLYNLSVPGGYHVATKAEIEDVVRNYQMTGKNLSFPIYTDIKSSVESKTQNFTIQYYNNNRTSNIHKTEEDYRFYREYKVVCTFIKDPQTSSILNLSYIEDPDYSSVYRRNNKPADATHYRLATRGLLDMSRTPPYITPGYVYVIKNTQ